jgi:hypothetical protein
VVVIEFASAAVDIVLVGAVGSCHGCVVAWYRRGSWRAVL